MLVIMLVSVAFTTVAKAEGEASLNNEIRRLSQQETRAEEVRCLYKDVKSYVVKQGEVLEHSQERKPARASRVD